MTDPLPKNATPPRGPGTLAVFLGLFYLGVGAAQIFGAPFFVERFRAWGYGDGFRLFIGLLQMMGGVLLLFRRSASFAAIALSLLMLGAVYTHLFLGVPVRALIPVAALAGLGRVAVVRWTDLVDGMERLTERYRSPR